ncbi:hypothetical protein H1R20_g8479, partial [Candolleomyces eurysporus]
MASTHSDIIKKVPGAYESALKSGDLFYFPSTIEKHNELDIDFEITLCPALQKKPTLPSPRFEVETTASEAAADDTKIDPFAPPYNPQLHVGDLKDELTEEEFVILLNKFSVVPHHFLLVPKGSKISLSALIGIDASWAGGENSGASQPHKHIQFLPTESPLSPPIETLARKAQLEQPTRPFSLTSLPYASSSFRFPSYLDTFSVEDLEKVLSDVFLQLLDLCISTVRHDPDYPPGRPSYNVIITLEHMHLVPRKFETHLLEKTGERLPVNALGFAGMLLVKSEQELDAVRYETVAKILRGVGLESVHEDQVEGTAKELTSAL